MEVSASGAYVGNDALVFTICRDISNRKKADQALQNSEKKFRRIFENIQDVYYETNVEGIILEISPSIEIHSNGLYHREDCIGKQAFLFYENPNLREIFIATLQKNNSVIDYEVNFINRDGSIVPCSVSAKLHSDEKGDSRKIIGSIRDITERKQAEQRLRESEERYRSIISVSNTGAWEYHSDTNSLWCSQEYFTMLGYDTAEYCRHDRRNLQETWVNLLHPEDRNNALQLFAEYLLNGSAGMYENKFRMKHKDGHWVWIWSRGQTLRNQDGTLSKLTVGTHIDITALKMAELALEYKHAEIEAIYNFAPVMLCVIDTNGQILFANNSFKEFTNFSEFQVTESSPGRVLRCINALNNSEGCGLGEECLNCTLRLSLEETIKTRQGKKDIEHRMSVLQNGIHREIFLIGSVVIIKFEEKSNLLLCLLDITERKQIEIMVQKGENYLRKILQTTIDGFMVVNKIGYIINVNDAYCIMSGYSRDELLKLHINDLDALEDSSETMIRMNRVIENGSELFNSSHRRKDSSVFELEISVTYLDQNGGEFVSFCRDITERKEAEKERKKLQSQLIQTQRMESVGSLAGGIAHDFNNMLAVILGHVEMAFDRIDKTQPLFSDLQAIRSAAERSSNLTRQLFAFARRQSAAPKVLHLNDTIESMLKMLRRLIGENIDLIWIPGPYIWNIMIDPSQIDQILANLCVNARDAINGIGKVTIKTKNTVIDEKYCSEHFDLIPGEYVVLDVSDDGCGMNKEILERIFEPFFTTKEIGKGTGLGLATVYGIVKQNNAHIEVSSALGEGTTFSIYFPRHSTEAAEIKSENVGEIALSHGETIMLVEDEIAILNLGKMMLKKLGYQILAAGSPKEAFEAARKHNGEINLIITDVIMPEMNGRDLVQQFCSIYPNIKHIYMSGYTADVIAHHGVLEKGIHFIQKPFSIKDLSTKVREVLD